MRGELATVAVADASHDPHAYEFVRPERMRAILQDEPVAFLPVGCLEYHGPHQRTVATRPAAALR